MECFPKALNEYFVFLDKLSSLWESTYKKTSKPLSVIESLSEEFQAASCIGHDVSITRKFPSLKENVMFKTLMSLEQELLTILNIVCVLDDATDKLNCLAKLIDYQREINITKSASIMRSKLFEYAYDCRQYFQARYSGLQIALKSLDFRDSNSIRAVRCSLIEDVDLKKHVQCCILLARSALVAEKEDSSFIS